VNNSVIHSNNTTYIRIDNWWIGIHLVNDYSIVIYVDNDLGTVIDEEAETEDSRQWGRVLRVASRGLFPRGKNTLFNRMRVVTPMPHVETLNN